MLFSFFFWYKENFVVFVVAAAPTTKDSRLSTSYIFGLKLAKKNHKEFYAFVEEGKGVEYKGRSSDEWCPEIGWNFISKHL